MESQTPATQAIGEDEIREAASILAEYKQGKANLEQRIVEDELWYKLRHWEVIRRTERAKRTFGEETPEPTSAWLFNTILNKHADAMDNYPDVVVLPREQSDEGSAKTLSAVLPVVMEVNGFDATYSAAWWKKLKHGTAVYGVYWDSDKENGLGDISVQEIDLLRVFWEPGITDIQRSSNLFVVELVDTGALEEQYPQYKGKIGGDAIDVSQYIYDDAVDTSDKSLVVDWYYKRRVGGRTVLHYVKFAGDALLYASENDPLYSERGYYDHGEYPLVFDIMFPEEGTPVGFGYVAICKDPQLYIDKLYGNILDYALKASHPRHFIAASTGVNEQEYSDWSKPLVHVEGTLDDTRIRQISLEPISSIYTNILQMKIEEMKDTAANRDVNAGGVSGGVTAASAIAALQEAGNKVSRDMIAASYRSYVRICSLCVELMRQFYDEARSFRVTGQMGSYDFIQFSAQSIREQPTGVGADGKLLYRRPIFDLKMSAEKKNPFSRMEQNERAKELYSMGFFNPERAQEALGALEMMEFEGIDRVLEQARQGQTLLAICQQMSQQMDQMAAIIQALTGKDMGIGGATPSNGRNAGDSTAGSTGQASGRSTSGQILRASTPMAGYGQRLAQRSSPNLEGK